MTDPVHDPNAAPTAADIRSLATEVRRLSKALERSRRRLIATIIVFTLCFALGTVALYEVYRANSCLNQVLADRSGPTTHDNTAHAEFAKEASRWVASLNLLFTVAPGSKASTAAVKSFKDESVTFQIVINSLSNTLAADQESRNAHPLGQCT